MEQQIPAYYFLAKVHQLRPVIFQREQTLLIQVADINSHKIATIPQTSTGTVVTPGTGIITGKTVNK